MTTFRITATTPRCPNPFLVSRAFRNAAAARAWMKRRMVGMGYATFTLTVEAL